MITDNSQAQRQFNSERDRITQLLTKQANPSKLQQGLNLASSFLTALSQNSGAAGVDQAYSQYENKQNEAKANLYQLMQDQVKQGNEDAAHVDQTIKDFVGSDPKAYEAVANELHNSPVQVGRQNAVMEVSKAANKLGIKSYGAEKEKAALEDVKSQSALRRAQANYYNNRGTGLGPMGQKAPSGYRYTPTGDLEQIPGGPADFKRQQAEAADAGQLDMVTNNLNTLQGSINDVVNAPGLEGIVGVRGKFPNIPGSDAANAQALLDTLNSKAFVGAINAMRAASKTGGAVGNVSNKEGDKLQNSFVALKTSQSLPEFKKNLQKFYSEVEDTKNILKNSFNRKYRMSQAPSSSTNDEDYYKNKYGLD